MLLAAALNGLGIVFKDTGRFRDAAAAYEQALQLCQQALGPDDPGIANLLHDLAGLAHAEGRVVKVRLISAEGCSCAGGLKHRPRLAPQATSPYLALGYWPSTA
jgi:hypothetical protein